MAIPFFHLLPFTWASVGAATTISRHVFLPAIVSMREGSPEPPACFRQGNVIGMSLQDIVLAPRPQRGLPSLSVPKEARRSGWRDLQETEMSKEE